jgi:hypothetical protein
MMGWMALASTAVAAWVYPASACSISCALSYAAGPHSMVEIAIVIPVIAIVAFAFIQAIRFTLRPGKHTPTHIKWRILEEDQGPL